MRFLPGNTIKVKVAFRTGQNKTIMEISSRGIIKSTLSILG
jgi:hypothetical protein